MATVYTFPYKEGLALATKEINEAGGVLGRPLEFIHRDDKLKPDEAVKAARELVLQDKVDFLAGCISSGVGLAISAYAKDAKVLYFATHCQTSRLTWDDGHLYVAHTTNNVNQYVRVAAKKASTLPIKKWANISPDYEYGHNMWEEFSTYLKKLKPDVQFVQLRAGRSSARPTTAPTSPRCSSPGPRGSSARCGAPSRSPSSSRRAPSGSSRRCATWPRRWVIPTSWTRSGKEAPVGAIATPFAWYDAGLHKLHPKLEPWTKKWIEWAKTRGLKDPQPKLGASWGYASAYIIAEAIKRAKSTDTDKVIAVLSEGFEMEFPWGKVIMRGCDQQALPPQWIGVVKLDAQGKPIATEVEETHGKDVVRSCDEVKELRAAAAAKQKK